jgi:peptidoglycan/xylan/chitin deacetylase (PgdA/CDA1 family)
MTNILLNKQRNITLPNGVRRAWLTFDDGPHLQHTSTILDALSAQNVTATFFVVGKNVHKASEALLVRARNEGHRIGNHGFSHKVMSSLTESEVISELTNTEKRIAQFLDPEKLFRPPYGATSTTVVRLAESLGYRQVLWDVDTRDWNAMYQPMRWVGHTLDQIRGRESSVLLAHDVHATTAAHIHEIIQSLRQAGVMLAGAFEGVM